jgi:hypothetical protein
VAAPGSAATAASVHTVTGAYTTAPLDTLMDVAWMVAPAFHTTVTVVPSPAAYQSPSPPMPETTVRAVWRPPAFETRWASSELVPPSS